MGGRPGNDPGVFIQLLLPLAMQLSGDGLGSLRTELRTTARAVIWLFFDWRKDCGVQLIRSLCAAMEAVPETSP